MDNCFLAQVKHTLNQHYIMGEDSKLSIITDVFDKVTELLQTRLRSVQFYSESNSLAIYTSITPVSWNILHNILTNNTILSHIITHT